MPTKGVKVYFIYFLKINEFLKSTGISRAGFLNHSTTDILEQIFVVGGCFVQYRMCNSIPGFNPSDANSVPFPQKLWQSKLSSDIAKWPRGGGRAKIAPRGEYSVLENVMGTHTV